MGRAYLAISIVTVLWATNFSMAKIGTAQIDPFFIAAFRVFATSAVFYAFLPREQRKLAKSDIKAFLPLALTGIVTNHICFASGIKLTTPSHSAVIHALVPVFVALSGWILIREKLGPVGMIGMALAVAGALVVVLRAPAQEFQGTLVGDILTTIGIVGFSLYTVLGRDRVSRMGGFRVVTFAFVFAIPFMIPALFYGLWRQDWSVVTWKGWVALAYMFLCANLICYVLHIFALSRLTAGQVAAFTDLQPAIGIGVAVLLGLDRITATLVLGSLIALAGVVLVQLRR